MEENLRKSPLFRGIGDEELALLFQCLAARERSYEKGEVILAEGAPTEQLGVMLSGRALIGFGDAWGNESVLSAAEPGDIFAEAYACLPGEPLRVSVTAAGRARVLFLNVGRILTHCENACAFHGQLVRNLLAISARKNLRLSGRMLHTGPKTIRGRLMSYFSQCVKEAGGAAFDIPYDRQQLADYLGVDRSALCAELSKMRRDGLLSCKKNHFEILTPPEA